MKSRQLINQRLVEDARRRIGNSGVSATARRLDKLLRAGGYPYALVGGYAVQQYGYTRFTQDVDVVVPMRSAVRVFLLASKEFKEVAGEEFMVKDAKNGVLVDLMPTGRVLSNMPIPGAVKKGPGLQFVSLPELISMKLSAKRMKDQADVVELIKANELGLEFMDEIPHSEHREFVRLYQQAKAETG